MKKSLFSENLILTNDLNEIGFKEWVLFPGMLFNSKVKWWGDRAKRQRPHEGLDLCMFRNIKGEIIQLDDKVKIPAMYHGTVVGIMSDFIGKSVVLEHIFTDNDNSRFCTLYGHVIPHHDVRVGAVVKEGDIIATLAFKVSASREVKPHLHISLGKISGPVSYKDLDWSRISTSDLIELLDPLQFLDMTYELIISIP